MASKQNKQKGIYRNPILEDPDRPRKHVKENNTHPYLRDKNMLIKEIAEDTDIRESVVRTVLDRFTDISIEALVNGEYFGWPYIMSVYENERNIAVQNMSTFESVENMKQVNRKILQPKMNQSLKKLHKAQTEHFADYPYLINRDTWRGALEWINNSQEYKEAKRERMIKDGTSSNKITPKDSTKDTNKIYNPLLDNDDE